MNIEDVYNFCKSIKGSEECFPFGEDVVVFKIMDKMFAYFSLEATNDSFRINLKCDPEKAIELRERYEGIQPGYHANKRYWNSIFLGKDVTPENLKYLINHSIDEVIRTLPKKKQEEYKILYSQNEK